MDGATLDVANAEEEENFDSGVRRKAHDFAAVDVDNDNKLDFDEFCAMVRDREEGEHTDEDLRQRFTELDADRSGKVDMNEYIRWALRDALARSSARVIDLFRQWDEDGSGVIERKEFRRAIRALGFDFIHDVSEIDLVFDDFDIDKDGTLDYNELNTMLRQGASVILDDALKVGAAGEIATQVRQTHKLRKHRAKGKALPSSVVLKVSSRLSVQQQLQQVLRDNAVRVIDIFREWDEDGDGLVSKKEFRNAVSALGYQAPREDVDAVFSLFDEDGSGMIEYGELKRALDIEDPDHKVQDAKLVSSTQQQKGSGGGAGKRKTPERGRPAPTAPAAPRADACRGATATSAPGELSEEDVVSMSKKLYDALKGVDPDLRHFFTLFKSVDKNGSGRITFEELGVLVRQKLGLREKHLSQTQLLALWKKLDIDATGFIDAGELSRFMRIGQREKKPMPDIGSTGGSIRQQMKAGRASGAAPAGRVESVSGNPYDDVELLVEAAPLPLRVVGMPTGAMDQADMYDRHAAADGRRAPSAFERQLRSQLDGLLVGGEDDEQAGWPGAPPRQELTNALQQRRERVQMQAKQAHLEKESAAKVQAAARGHQARKEYEARRPKREWRFVKSHRRVVSVSESGSGPSTTMFYVQKHERLDLLAAEGSGRLMLDAADAQGRVVVEGSCVFDSALSALAITAKATAHVNANGQGAAAPALCSAPGEYLYTFRLEPRAGQLEAKLELKFQIESTFSDHDLASEPASEPAAQPAAATEAAYTHGAPTAHKTARERRREELASGPLLHLPTEVSTDAAYPSDPTAPNHYVPAAYELVGLGPGAHAYSPAPPSLLPDASGGGDPALGSGRGACFARAAAVEWQQRQSDARRGGAHLAALDLRAQQQLEAAGVAPFVPQPPAAAPPVSQRHAPRATPAAQPPPPPPHWPSYTYAYAQNGNYTYQPTEPYGSTAAPPQWGPAAYSPQYAAFVQQQQAAAASAYAQSKGVAPLRAAVDAVVAVGALQRGPRARVPGR